MEGFWLFVHIMAAATWIGASVTMAFLAPRFQAEGDAAGSAFMRGYEAMGKFVFNIAGIVLLVSGILLVTSTGWEFSDAFVSVGFLVVIVGAVLGITVFVPLARKAIAGYETGDRAAVQTNFQRIRQFGALDLGLLVIAVLAMVYKWGA